MLPRDQFVSRFLYFLYTAGIKCYVVAVKGCPYFTSVLLYFAGPSGSLTQALLSIECWVMLKPVLGGIRDVAHVYYPSCTDSTKRSLNSVVILLWIKLPREDFLPWITNALSQSMVECFIVVMILIKCYQWYKFEGSVIIGSKNTIES
jgi:hypothetical protein